MLVVWFMDGSELGGAVGPSRKAGANLIMMGSPGGAELGRGEAGVWLLVVGAMIVGYQVWVGVRLEPDCL